MGNTWMFGTCSRDIGNNVDQEVLGYFAVPNKKRNTTPHYNSEKTIVDTAVNTRTCIAISSTFTSLQSDLKRVAIAMQSPASLIWSNFIWNKDTTTEQDSNCQPYSRWTTCSTPWAIVCVHGTSQAVLCVMSLLCKTNVIQNLRCSSKWTHWTFYRQ